MATFKPFKALRPNEAVARALVSPPYDTVTTKEANEIIVHNPYSFLRVTRSDAFDIQNKDKSVDFYKLARHHLNRFTDKGVFKKDDAPQYYLYTIQKGSFVQSGFVGLTSVLEYEKHVIKKHEHTLPSKVQDRIAHFNACQAQTSPVFLTVPSNQTFKDMIFNAKKSVPLYDIEIEEERHIVHAITDKNELDRLEDIFKTQPNLYIADGHHRAESAYQVAKQNGHEDALFLSVIVPDDQLNILGYHRIVKGLGGLSKESFFESLKGFGRLEFLNEPTLPSKPHELILIINHDYFKFTFHTELIVNRPLKETLDTYLLEKHILNDQLGIKDIKTSDAIEFVGGIKPLSYIESTMKEDDVAFLLYPLDIQTIMSISQSNQVLPPKSTWFEPKLKSGFFVYQYE